MSTPFTSCADCPVRALALCASLPHDRLAGFGQLGRKQQLKRGETLIWAGDENRSCGNLLSGMLKVSASIADGREQIVGLLYPGEFVGQPFAGRAEFTVTALSDVSLCMFPREGFERVMAEYPEMERVMLRRVIAALNDARSRMLMLARKSAEERIAGFLLEMAQRMGVSEHDLRSRPVTFDLPISRGQIAEVLGLTIETVSRQFTRLKSAGLIVLPGGRAVTILDDAALEARAEAA
jgi:CRP/FNR family transcriptional regulator